MIIFKQFGLTLFTLLLCLISTAQPDFNILSKWDYTPAGTAYERINKVIACSNGLIVAVGETSPPFASSINGLFLVLNEDGTTRLRQQFGGSGNESFNSVVQNFDGTFTLVGYAATGKKSPRKGWVVQVDLEGNELFSKVIPSAWKGNDELKDAAINNKGEVLAVGWQNDLSSSDLWLVRIDNQEISDRTLGRGELGQVAGIAGGPEDNFIILGNTRKRNRQHPEDAWLLNVDKNGDDRWGGPRYLGDKGFQEGLAITTVTTGGYAIAGVTNSRGNGSTDKWLVKLNNSGEKEWERTYGGAAADVATSIIELSEGGYALFGQTLSYLARAKYSAAELLITDINGQELDSDTYITGATGGHEYGLTLTETYKGDIIVAGALVPEKSSQLPHVFISASTYKPFQPLSRSNQAKADVYGDAQAALQLSSSTFFDANKDQSLDAGERGYFIVEVSNQGSSKLENVSGRVTNRSGSAQIDFWENNYIGTLQAGQSKQLKIPVSAKNSLPRGEYQLDIAIESNGKTISNTTATIISNRPDPAKLIASGSFSPLKNPAPNESITLTVELLNAGGLPSPQTEAYFRIPASVTSFGSEKIIIPALQPHKPHQIRFNFKYANTFPKKHIDIQFETKGNGIPPILKTFQLELGSQPMVGRIPDEMIWLSHDPDESGTRNFDVATNEVPVKVKVMSRKQLKKGSFSVLINSRKAQGQKMDEVGLSSPENDMGRFRQTYTNKIRLQPGPNKVRIQYEYPDGTIFTSRELVFNYTPQGQPRLVVLSIGVPYPSLKFTTKDADDFGKLYGALQGKKNGFKKVDIYVLNDKSTTTTNYIRETFEKLKLKRGGFNLKKEDLLVVYLSAHGKVNNWGEFLLMPSDYKQHAEKTYSINFKNDILRELKFVECKKLVFLDACHSGSAFAGSKDWDDGDAASRMMNDLIKTAPGIEIIASCGENEFSYEDESWGNGAFTKAISEAFTNQQVSVEGGMTKADILSEIGGEVTSGSDGKISLRELKQFIQKRVPYLVTTTKQDARTGQHPSNKSTDLLPENMGIYYLTNNN